jgi:hypothetical protein
VFGCSAPSTFAGHHVRIHAGLVDANRITHYRGGGRIGNRHCRLGVVVPDIDSIASSHPVRFGETEVDVGQAVTAAQRVLEQYQTFAMNYLTQRLG